MKVESGLRLGVCLMAFGTMLVGLSLARVITGWNPGPGWVWFELIHCSLGIALGLWGWFRLRRAKAASPELTWGRFLRDDLIMLGIVVVSMAGFLSLSIEQRNSLIRSFLEFVELWSMARGGP